VQYLRQVHFEVLVEVSHNLGFNFVQASLIWLELHLYILVPEGQHLQELSHL
jgi:hypothetical protein